MNTKTSNSPPLGISFSDGQVNFSIHAPLAKSLNLQIFSELGEIAFDIPLDDKKNKTGSIWHISVHEKDVLNLCYLYLVDNIHPVLDPYAKFLNTDTKWKSGAKPVHTKAVIKKVSTFDWEKVKSPTYHIKDLIIYEMHTRSFTIKSDVKHPGTFLGIIEKIPHLKSLGINAIELMPIHEFNECENPIAGLYNYWGYSPLSYFAFMERYGAIQGNILDEFKTLVKELHKEKIAIIIDVVYNHTAEGGANGPSYNFKHLDPRYYIRGDHGEFIDYSGCGNTIDANYDVAMELILDSLRYLAVDCHVDGFRFDLASTFYRDAHGTIHHPKIIKAILDDPVLSKKILIAEAWDAKGLYQVGHFPKPFADWNGAYRDKVRSFINHYHGSKGAFADAITGTHSLYHSKTPDLSINFITAHDGFSLFDLFSYSHKHNQLNGEHNRDGNDHNISKNWGVEGITLDPAINETRNRLIRLSFAILFLSLGTPMMLMGDEYGHTRDGNNNPYCQDNELNYFLWDKIDDKLNGYIFDLTELRKKIKRFGVCEFYHKDELKWLGIKHDEPEWNKDDYFIACLLDKTYLFIINAGSNSRSFLMPSGDWQEIFCSLSGLKKEKVSSSHFNIEAHSLYVFLAKT